MKKLLYFTLTALTIYLTGGVLPFATASPSLLERHRSHVSGKWYADQFPHRRYARTAAANLNVGEPRTVRLIYFLPTDRPYRAEVVQQIKDEVRRVQTFYAEQMAAHGYGQMTFRLETDAQGELMVHRVDGRHPDSHYLNQTSDLVFDEMAAVFDIDANIYLTVIDNSIDGIVLDDEIVAGVGGSWSKNGGWLLTANETLSAIAHELGHGFGLEHDFRDGAYIMSYGPGETRLAACSAEYLSVHPYFNSNTPIEQGTPPTITLLSPHTYPEDANNISIRLQISGVDGLHQAILHLAQPDNRWTIKTCRGLKGETNTIVQFDYDGVIPSAHDPTYSIETSLLNPRVHPMHVKVVDRRGDWEWIDFVLFPESLQPLSKISGDNQHGLPNTPLPVPLVVELRDLSDGFPLYDMPVTFTVTAGGGSLTVEQATTDYNGRAESLLTLGADMGENRVEVHAAGHSVTFTAVAGEPVEIPDQNLRAAIEDALGKPHGQPIAPAEMLTLTFLYADAVGVRDLMGLEGAINLTVLSLGDNNITDISAVASLTKLTELHLWDNEITNITPIAGLTRLTSLDLAGNAITDISALARLTHLQWLILVDNSIADLSPLLANTGLGAGDEVVVFGNPLSHQAINTHLPTLERRGVTVVFDDQTFTVDVNGDGVLNVFDLVVIAAHFGQSGPNPADVNGDGVVNILDLVLVAGLFDDTAAAPSAQAPNTLSAIVVQRWLTDVKSLAVRDPILQRGILVLEQLLVSLTPTKTVLLANYPNPFNPETWIPYQLAEPADVTLTVYDANGVQVRRLDLGYQLAGYYTDRTKAAHWDGRNATGENVASGLYFYHLNAGGYSKTRKMFILK